MISLLFSELTYIGALLFNGARRTVASHYQTVNILLGTYTVLLFSMHDNEIRFLLSNK